MVDEVAYSQAGGSSTSASTPSTPTRAREGFGSSGLQNFVDYGRLDQAPAGSRSRCLYCHHGDGSQTVCADARALPRAGPGGGRVSDDYEYGSGDPVNAFDLNGQNKCEAGLNPLRWGTSGVCSISTPVRRRR